MPDAQTTGWYAFSSESLIVGFLELPPREWSLPVAWEPPWCPSAMVGRTGSWPGSTTPFFPPITTENMGSEVVTVFLITESCIRPNVVPAFLYYPGFFGMANTEPC